MEIRRRETVSAHTGHRYTIDLNYEEGGLDVWWRDQCDRLHAVWVDAPDGVADLHGVPEQDRAEVARVVADLDREAGAVARLDQKIPLAWVRVEDLRGLFGLLSAQGSEVWSLGVPFTPPDIEGAEPLTSLIWVDRAKTPQIRASLDLNETGEQCVVGQGATVGEAQADAWRLYVEAMQDLLDDYP